MRVTVEAGRLRRQLADAQRRALNLKPAMEDIGEEWLISIRETFDAEGRPERWEPRKPRTGWARLGGKRKASKKRGGLRAKAKRKAAGMKILTATARLRRSITRRATSKYVEVGSNLDYAATHQFGRNTGKGAPIPARPYLEFQDSDWPKFESILEEHIVGDLSE